MLFNIITNLGESFAIFIFGAIVIYLLSFILRISFSGKVFKIFLATIILSSIIHITQITVPEQNQYIILLIITLFYLFLFYIIKKIKKGSNRVGKLKYSYIFVIFLVFIMLIGKGEFLDNGSRIVSPDINIGTSGEVFYKSFGGIKSSIGLFNEYGDSTSDYDTIKYDLNLDGFVDIKTIDIDENGEIDDIIVYTYNTQKVLLAILLLVFIIITYLFSNGGKGKGDKGDLDKKGKKKFKLNLEGLKILGNDSKNIKKDDNIKRGLSLVLLLLMLLQISYVSAYREADLIGTPEYIKGDKICKYFFSLKGCEKCNKSFVPQGKEDFYIIDTINYIKNITNSCNSKTRPAIARFQLGQYIKGGNDNFIEGSVEDYIKYMDKELNTFTQFGTIDEENTSTGDNVIIPTIDKIITPEKVIKGDKNGDKVWGVGNIENIDLGDDSNYLDDYKNDDSTEDKSIIKEVEIINGLKVVGSDKKNIDIKKKVDDALKSIKIINDGTNTAIDGINKIKGKIKKIGNGGVIDKKTIDNIRRALKKIALDDGIKGINNLIDNSKKAGGYIKNIGGKVGKIFNGLGVIGDVIEGYGTYENSRKKYKGDNSKIYADSGIKIVGKTLIGSNPIDFGMGLLSGGASMLGFEDIAKKIDNNTIGNRYEQVVDIANNEEGSSINKTIDSSATDFLNVYNNPSSGTFNKVTKFAEFSSVMVVGMLGFSVQAGMGVFEGGIDAFSGGSKEIMKFFN